MWDKWKKGVPVIESSSDKIGKMKTGLDSMTGSLGTLADSFKNVFSKIATVVQDVASGFADGWKSAINDVGALVQSVVGAIGGILSTNFSNRENEMSDYYSNEKDAIENSTMNEKGKSDALKKLGKEEQKERKKLMRDQAKDQKTVAIFQAIISGALATVMAFATPGVGIAMGLIVAALSAVEIAAIIAQPLPSLAEGGLAFAPTMAMVGDNPNAAADPEVIAPLSKIRSLFQGAAQKIEIFGRLAGSDIFLSSEKGGVTVQRVRGY
ncbi:hypothetical protein D4R20_03425 [bacterium]|nr:MAG: hypothetical protein D4R20_03425 [bacterium]